MSYTSFIQLFDIVASCYIYGCISYISILFILHLYHSLFIDSNKHNQALKPDFHEQAKDLLNPSTVKVIETDFTSMTIRQLRTYIKDNQIHNKIRQSIGKTVSNASKLELITALN